MNLVELYLNNRIGQIVGSFNEKHYTDYFIKDGYIHDLIDGYSEEIYAKRVKTPIKLCKISDITAVEVSSNCIYMELKNGNELQLTDIGYVPDCAMNYRKETNQYEGILLYP